MIRRIICLILVAVLLIGVPVIASAAVFDPYDYGTVSIDGDNEVVTIQNNFDSWYWRSRYDGSSTNIATSSGSGITFSTTMANLDNITVEGFPFGYQGSVSSGGIPGGSTISGEYDFSTIVSNATQTFDAVFTLYLKKYDLAGNTIGSTILDQQNVTDQTSSIPVQFRVHFSTDLLSGCESWAFVLGVNFDDVANESDTVTVTVNQSSAYFILSIPYSQLYQLKAQGEKTNKLLEQIGDQMSANGEKLDDIIEQGQANGDKLDDMNQSIETLPGAVGDEIQDIVDKEQQEAENEGNANAGEIVDIIPDPSKDLIPSLQKLVAAMNYTGTSAVITMPAITIPAIDGMFPAIRVLDQQQVDFEDWFLKMPEKIMIVIRAFFDICLVGYCGKEILGLIASFAGGVQDISRETED